jgi:hypothetical protein
VKKVSQKNELISSFVCRAIYYSYDRVKESEGESIQVAGVTDYLGLLNEPGTPHHISRLKVGAVCSIARNLSVQKGLVKNARVTIKRLFPLMVEVELLDPPIGSTETKFCIPRINFCFQPKHAPWTVERRQIPLRLAYATTFNGCQGLTLDRVVLDLRTPVFAHGQLYTSLSRVRRREDARIFVGLEPQNCSVPNIVYHNLLLPSSLNLIHLGSLSKGITVPQLREPTIAEHKIKLVDLGSLWSVGARVGGVGGGGGVAGAVHVTLCYCQADSHVTIFRHLEVKYV